MPTFVAPSRARSPPLRALQHTPPCRPSGRRHNPEVGIDELGYLPLAGEGAAALFQVIQRRYLKGSIILTTNRAVGAWGDIFDDTVVAAAMLDRLLHRATVVTINGASYRLRAHQARAQILRDHLRAGGDQ